MSLAARFRDAPIRRKLMLVSLLTSGMALLFIIIALSARGWVEWRARTVSDMTIYAKVIGTNATSALLFDDRNAAAETLSALSANPDIIDAVIYDKTGRIFARFIAPRYSPSAPIPPLKPGSFLFSFNQLLVSEPILSRGEVLGSIYLEFDPRNLYASILRDTILIFLVALCAFLASILLFSRIQKIIVDPIMDLSNSMREVSDKQDYAVRVAVHGKDEVGLLARTFNDMLKRIQQRDDELAQHRAHLEQEVALRTAELSEANRLLEHELAERRLAEEKIRRLNEELEIRVQQRTRQLLEAQDELVRKEKLAVLGQVAGSVGHELRNPLGVMSNAVYFLQTVLTDADDTTREYLDIIKGEIACSERIVSDLLDAVRTRPPHPEAVGVRELMEQTLRKYTVPASVTVTLDIPESLPPLMVDAMQIQQVLRNLITNGAEAMQAGGMLEIRAVENKPEGTIIISVRDTGIGITPEQFAKLFQPLFTTKARGIGLGLVVVKNLTEANGGKVDVQSEHGVGATFTVTLPAADSPGFTRPTE